MANKPYKFSRQAENLIANLRGVPENYSPIVRETVDMGSVFDNILTRYKIGIDSLEDQTCYTCGVLALKPVGVYYIPDNAPDDAYNDVGNDDDEGMCHFCSPECLEDWMVKDISARVIQKTWRKWKGCH